MNFSVPQVGLGKTVKTDVHVSTVENVTTLLENATVLLAGRVICVVENVQKADMDITVPKSVLTV